MTEYEEYLEKYGYVDSLVGVNENNEYVVLNIDENAVSVSTSQNNGGMRHNIYYKDGTSEEYFDK